MSDSIEFISENTAFGLAVHCDARSLPQVFFVSEGHTSLEKVDPLKKVIVSSKSRFVDNAELTIFKPVVLQPLTSNARINIENWKKALKKGDMNIQDSSSEPPRLS